ncbi:polymorphic toxin-type HINT domain-containing protein [Streptomyces sp. NBC_01318]|uniref:polymorphic toxin-type HINT domain-containing protein n=1 Tax=Streptomyces sp. NBC_01318 TaxID=2903823 RepID=UPI002E108CC6|nr:polymorphic toxin-type HINT domain-containing protein [Streptomyces sp. NBC_01318]
MPRPFRIGRKASAAGRATWSDAVARYRIPVIGLLTLVLSVPGALVPLTAQAAPLGRPDVPKSQVTKVKAITTPGAKAARDKVAKGRAANKRQAEQARAERAATWPGASKTLQDLNSTPDADAIVSVAPAKPGKAARSAAPPAQGKATVQVLDQAAARKAGVTGVLFTATADQAGTAQVSVDYSKFASAVGGAWSTRLGLVRLPSCVLTTPHKDACRTTTPVVSSNDLHKATVTAPVTLAASDASGPTVLALMSDTTTSAKGAGDFNATPLSASSTWEAGGSSGSFTWSYPLTVPPAAAGPVPSLSLSYDSGSIDGRTANTNNQGSQIGEGFDLTSSYIERKYGSCDDDGQTDKFDLCWKYENASLVLNGKASELVKDDTSGKWHLKNDDASQVTLETGATNDDNNGEHWKVVTGDGTTYTFGLNKLPGANTERTNSVWTVPVFGDDAGEPGYSGGSAFADRSVTQAWRWNLDLVQDVHGNASTYWYKDEANSYAKNGDKSALVSYTRGGYLEEIRYGQRADTLFTGTPSGKVDFDYKERCTAVAVDCSLLTKDTADNWPDVPFDAICAADATDCLATGPAFFTRKRMTGINTFVWSTAAEPDAYLPVDSYALTQEFMDGQDIGNSSDQTLTLKSLQRTGKNGTEIEVPPVDFTYRTLPNRVDSVDDDILPLSRPRIDTVTSETGAITTVSMYPQQCVRGTTMPAAEDDNDLSCYPVYWGINGGDPALDWFHKYRVMAVNVSDPAGQNTSVETSYTYENPGWHYNDDPMTKEKERTWSIWRGYGTVTAYTGPAGGTRSKTVSTYMQGMNGDKRKGTTTTRTASVKGIDLPGGLDIVDLTDADQYSGTQRQTITYDGNTAIASTVNTPWSKRTATQHKSYADTEAYYVRAGTQASHTYLTAKNSWRSTATDYSYDSYGMVTRVNAAGDTAKSGDETCTRYWYARNDAKGLMTPISRTRVVGSTCTDTSGAVITDDKLNLPTNTDTRGDVLSDTAVVYDDTTAVGWSATQTPTLGLPTWTGRAKAYPAASGANDRDPSAVSGWQTVTKTTFDTATSKLGRPLTVTDTAGRITSTAYAPADKGPVTAIVVTAPRLASNGQQHKSYTYFDVARGQTIRSLDANLKETNNTYDSLGRITATWLPNRNKAGGDSANAVYGYGFERGKQPWTSVATLKADGTTYKTTYSIYDSLLRPLQTQTPSALGGRLLTDTRYDARGLAFESFADLYDNTSAPNSTYTRAEYGHTPKQTETVFDGAGRITTSQFLINGVKKWETTTSYTGDSVATTALQGGTASRTVTDALGRTTETRTYAGTNPDDKDYGATLGSTYTRVASQYTRDGQPSLITGPDNAQWTYAYDLFGRQSTTTDPDKGTGHTSYTDLDQVDTTLDANNKTLLYGYDELGRKTDLWQTSRTDANKLAHWGYDSILKGLPDTSTRYEGGVNQTGSKAFTDKVTAVDSLGRPTSTDLILPSDDPLVTAGAIAATTTYGIDYRIDGTVNNTKEPAAGGLPAEIIQTDYNAQGMPTGLSGTTGYLLGVDYSATGLVNQLTLGTSTSGAKKAYVSNTYEAGTDRLLHSDVTDQTHPWKAQDLNYSYDQVGNVTAINDPATLGGTSKPDYQCFTYDGQRHLTEAWTPKTADCAAAGRTAANIDGQAPYWTSYTYNTAGQRATETQKTGTPTTTTYCYSTSRPHALAATTKTTSCTGIADQYKYDTTGNTTQRTEKAGSATSQTLAWSPEGKLSKLTEGAASTNYIYGADGDLLIRRDSGGETVLYLGATEVHLKAGKTWANRYYSVGGSPIALRTNESGTAKLSFLAGDQHGTASLALDSETQTLSKRYTNPFGTPRGTPTGTWPDDKTFLGKPTDTGTGLTHIGAREYDPTIGQFISVDPVLTVDQHQSLNGYSYANQHPTTSSDPTGLCDDPVGNGHCQAGKTGKDAVDTAYPTNTNPAPGKTGGTATSGTSSGSDDSGDDCGFFSTCGWSNAWDNTKDWTRDHKAEILSAATEVVVGGLCYGGAVAAAGATGGVSLAATAGCGALAGAAGAAVNNALSEDADHSTTGTLTDMAEGAIWGAAGAVVTTAIAGKILSKVMGACHSFLPGTGVLLADGTHKAIEDVEVGDTVITTDTATGKSVEKKVVSTITTEDDKEFTEVTIATGDELSSIVATDTHPFWVPELKKWIKAGDLQVGQWLRTSAGTHVQITALSHYTKRQRTHDLTIEDIHAYYVLAGATPVLVHNCGASIAGHSTSCACATGAQPRLANGRMGASLNPRPARAASTHGNSRNSTATNYLYVLEDASDTYLKVGITDNPAGRYSARKMAAMGADRMRILTSGSRTDMLNIERYIEERWPGPLNNVSWAGKMRLDGS